MTEQGKKTEKHSTRDSLLRAAAGRNTRVRCIGLLYQWLTKRAFADTLLEQVESDRAFVMEVVYGCIRWQRLLQRLVRKFVDHRPDPVLEAALWVGLYQMLFMDTVKDYAAVHETVEAVKRLRGNKAARFVNAVLRRVQAEGRGPLLEWMRGLPAPVRLSHPTLLFERWERNFGRERAERLCEWNNQRAELTIRVNNRFTTVDAFIERLHAVGWEAVAHPADPKRFVRIPHGLTVTELPGFTEGWFYVQDPSTAMPVDLLGPKSGETVLDACAAPGGKTALLAEILGDGSRVVAVDVDPQRVERLRANLQRLGCTNVTVIQANVQQPDMLAHRLRESGVPVLFDAVLLDVPCTNTGVIRRRPDAKWRFTEKRLEKACFVQRALLRSIVQFVRPSGRLVYSTCSLEPEENEQQVRDFLAEHPEFELVTTQFWLPPDSQTDGAFAALLVKRT